MAAHYGKEYFTWQAPMGEFGGWANAPIFSEYISNDDIVLDFGCGGGYLLNNLTCRHRIGVDINPEALKVAAGKGIDTYQDVRSVPSESIDVIITNHALEHTLNPFREISELFRALKPHGRIVCVVPCETIHTAYRPDDPNHHLFSWGPLTLGNLFTEAGFTVLESKPHFHQWPPFYRWFVRLGGRTFFDFASRVYSRIDRRNYQIRLVGEKPASSVEWRTHS